MASPCPTGAARGVPGLAVALAALAVAAAEPREAAGARTAYVRSEAGFAAAVARFRSSGGTIVLGGGRYAEIAVGPRSRARLTIRGTRGASVGRLSLYRARSVRLVGLRVTPRGAPAAIELDRTRNVRLERVLVTGARTGLAASLLLRQAVGVTVSRSRFSRCGDRAVCILTGWSSRLRIVRSRFHDCFGCDFVRGNLGRGVVISRNRFDRSLVGPCGRNARRCNHQEMIEFHAGRGLVIERNRFGVYEPPGAGQVALFGRVRNVRIRNNLFLRTDRRVPGLVARNAINLGGFSGLPTRVVIAHNTMLSGRTHWRGFSSSIRLKQAYASIRRADRPVVANNVIRVAATRRVLCRGARLTIGNVIERGRRCSARDVVGPANLDGAGRPTASSELVIDRAASAWAPPTDIRGIRRDGRPDVGAYEYGRGRP